ncbi:hypothetical protein DM01DRAFT_1340791, partial [Hesseltinella vesiculosa]
MEDFYTTISLESVNEEELQNVIRSLVTPLSHEYEHCANEEQQAAATDRCESAAIFNYIDDIHSKDYMAEWINMTDPASSSHILSRHSPVPTGIEQFFMEPSRAHTAHLKNVTRHKLDDESLTVIRRDSDALIQRRRSLLHKFDFRSPNVPDRVTGVFLDSLRDSWAPLGDTHEHRTSTDTSTTTTIYCNSEPTSSSVTETAKHVLQSIRKRRQQHQLPI